MTVEPPHRRRSLPVHAAGVALALLPLLAGVTTAYAASPVLESARVVGVAGNAPAAAPTCRPWQTPTTVPPGVVLTPRVFPPPPAAPSTSASAPSTARANSPAATASSTAKPATPTKPAKPAKPRVICRNAPPMPFDHPQWAPGSVVGGERLGESGVVAELGAGVAPPPEVYDVSYVIADLDSGEILAAKSPHAWLRPASTLKTLTALTLMPRLDPRRVVVASEDAQEAAGSRVGILAGNRYTVGNLVDAMLMFSANDAVYALADAAGGYDKTVALMNDTAREIGAHDTVVVDPSGLDEGNQRSSAYDLALIARDAMRLPAFRAAVVKRDAVFPGGKDKQGKEWKPFHVYNINELLRHYPGAIGIKPGRTDRAQHTFIGAATRGGRTLVVAQMGSITGSWKPTAALLDWGFANADRVTPVGTLVAPGEAGPPTPQPSLTSLPDGSAATTPGSAPETGTPAPAPATADGSMSATAAATPTAADHLSLVTVSAAGALLTAAVAGLVIRHRRRREHADPPGPTP
ncbi:serine hydrolase [Humibacillus xanthopallidus]|uniref:D-alanyl-D-alanine carboxypeptidase (Penicillin-binding protein 5/6) n=1 Tax=Humibacillus xanthopallidus TaxID=412689 RepID=A0A543I064_9MICO|nr:serine hydrolase [Humibacillus xanthopallidus]TQM63979.1 D-alanyl-D-alanine carboxypeptidase (penicillin-binding protein 5/6) [Humibacillus xanthopallidus]